MHIVKSRGEYAVVTLECEELYIDLVVQRLRVGHEKASGCLAVSAGRGNNRATHCVGKNVLSAMRTECCLTCIHKPHIRKKTFVRLKLIISEL